MFEVNMYVLPAENYDSNKLMFQFLVYVLSEESNKSSYNILVIVYVL